jgi:AraC-like DNA-binding protein
MSNAMLLLDVLLRYSSITILFLIAVLNLRDTKRTQQSFIVAALCISLGMMLLNTAPEILRPPEPAFNLLRLIDAPNIVFLWWFGLSLFDDDFRLGRFQWGIFLLYLAVVIPVRLMSLSGVTEFPIALIISNRLISFAMMGHLIWIAFSGRKDDLIEARRKMRLFFTIGFALACVAIVGAEMIVSEVMGNTSDPQWLSTLRVGIAVPMIVWSAFWFLQFRPELLKFEAVTRPVPKPATVDPKDTATLNRLNTAMQKEYLYREQGLGIGDLASRLNAPEHQLRALINKGLGYRNFSAFLNRYRLAEAKALLANPEHARTQILTIAMDVGYASLATFNRAFKTEESVTPSEFRAAALTKAAQS